MKKALFSALWLDIANHGDDPPDYLSVFARRDGEDDAGKKYEGIIDGMKCYTAEQLVAALKAAGFSEATGHHHPSKPWIAVIARK